MADAEALQGKAEREQALLREALEREPSLAEDPDFARRYQGSTRGRPLRNAPREHARN
jgi:hypothetical protein